MDNGDSDSDTEPPDLVDDSDSDDEEDDDKPTTLTKPSKSARKRAARKKATRVNGRVLTAVGKMPWHDVLLDNQADISVVHPRLLRNVRRKRSFVSGLSGTTELP